MLKVLLLSLGTVEAANFPPRKSQALDNDAHGAEVEAPAGNGAVEAPNFLERRSPTTPHDVTLATNGLTARRLELALYRRHQLGMAL